MIVHVFSVRAPHGPMDATITAFGRTEDGRFVAFMGDARSMGEIHYALARVSPFSGDGNSIIAYIEPYQIVREYGDG